MPNTSQAKKALRQAKKRAERNAIVRTAYKEAIKTVRKATAAGQDAKDMLRTAQQKLDKAAKRGVIRKKTAARKLSRLAKSMRHAAQKAVESKTSA